MAKLTDGQVEHIIDTVNLFDKNGNGKLPVENLVDCLRSLGLNPLELETRKVLREISDYHHEKEIEVEDFLPIYEYFLRKRKPTFQELCAGLKCLDPISAATGSIDAEDLRIALTTNGDKLSQNECSFILDQVQDCHNKVNIEHLVRLITGETNDEEIISITLPKRSRIHTAQIKIQQDEDEAIKKILDQTD